MQDESDLLAVLKSELQFLEKGGYNPSARTHWRSKFVFEDSHSCMNYDSKENRAPCSACILMDRRRPSAVLRQSHRHIPLGAMGETLDSPC
jgi:hypothetical protein